MTDSAAPIAPVKAVRTRLSGGYKLRMGVLFTLMLLIGLPIAMAARRNGHWLFWVASLSPLLLSGLLLGSEYRRSPRVLDAQGVVRRDGKRLRWDDFLEQRTIEIRTPGRASTGQSHTELHFRGGVVKIFPAMFDDLDGIYRFLARHHSAGSAPPPAPPAAQAETTPARTPGSCSTCGPLGRCRRGLQQHGREEEDSFLPAEAARLRRIKDVRPGQTRTPELMQCPTCGDHFLYEVTYEYLATGSEDEQILTRLSPDVARRYLDGWDGRSA